MTERVLVTGGSGFLGGYLVRALVKAGKDVAVLDRRAPDREAVGWIDGDLLERDSFNSALRDVRPTAVIHLAAKVNEPVCRANPGETFKINVEVTARLLEACRTAAAPPRVILALSSAIYGPVSGDCIDETTPLRPWTIYGATKAACDIFGETYWRNYGLEVIRMVPFNITGPGQSPCFVLSDWARQIARIEAGRQEPVMKIGNTSASRDFIDVRDAGRAFVAALDEGQPGERYNIASGHPTGLGSALEMLTSLSKAHVSVQKDPAKMRPSDIPVQVGSYRKLHADTGWAPSIPILQSISDLLDGWRRDCREGLNGN